MLIDLGPDHAHCVAVRQFIANVVAVVLAFMLSLHALAVWTAAMTWHTTWHEAILTTLVEVMACISVWTLLMWTVTVAVVEARSRMA